jgi:thioredoxin-related protein
MKGFIAGVGLLVLTTGAYAEVHWEKDYDAALEKAKKDKKLVMVDVYTDWCGWCKKLDKDTYSDKAVGEMLEKNFIALKVNPEKSKKVEKLSKTWETKGFPHIVFLDATGKKISEISGYQPPADFLNSLDGVVKNSSK